MKVAQLSAQCQQLAQQDERQVVEVARVYSCLVAQGIVLEVAHARVEELVQQFGGPGAELCCSALQDQLTWARAEVDTLPVALKV